MSDLPTNTGKQEGPVDAANPDLPPSAPTTNTAWATLVLQDIGAPTSQNNINNMLIWMAHEEPSSNWADRNNPLNASLGTSSSDGTAAYSDLTVGAQYTAQMIMQSNMSPIYNTLIGDGNLASFAQALVSSPWASSRYGGDPSRIENTPVPDGEIPVSGGAVSGSGAVQATAPGGTGTTDSSGTAIPEPPGMNDIPGLITYIKQYFGADAWLLNVNPQVATLIEDAVAQGYGNDTAYIQGQLAQSPWFQNTSQAYQTYLAQRSSNPGDYSFTAPGSKASQAQASITAAAAQAGVQLSTAEAQQMATMSLEYGWNTQQVNAAIGDTVYYKGSGGTAQTNAGSVISQLQAQAGQYLQSPSDPVLQSWAQNIAAGTQTMAQYEAYLKQNASLKWTGMSSQIQQGYTPNQIVDSMRSDAANLMEVDPSSIDFVNNPTYSKILDYVPPDSPNGVHRVMTQAEMNSYLMGTPQWASTLNARNAVSTLADQITTTFGKAP